MSRGEDVKQGSKASAIVLHGDGTRQAKLLANNTGTILVAEPLLVKEQPATSKFAVYTRVSSSENTSNLDSHAERLIAYCTVHSYQVSNYNTFEAKIAIHKYTIGK
ncbi:hypothetical protein KSZ_03160 [Dictyobacter formicarum]|uniref:Uncharacterized protein n=1 Tax=Dictyobacter formicarum TaxID=2778368 RepID=A0ABQ3V864_9CHLR|nr:hypothetical protein KSZ_03160 [Dictyobacter formicarum]